jgi:hypothetical protein
MPRRIKRALRRCLIRNIRIVFLLSLYDTC